MENRDFFRKLDEFHLSQDNRHDIRKILDVLVDDYIEITSSGAIKTYQDFAQLSRLDNLNFILLNHSFKIIDSNTVITYYQLHELEKNIDTMRSNIWKNQDGKWKMIFHQGTVIKK